MIIECKRQCDGHRCYELIHMSLEASINGDALVFNEQVFILMVQENVLATHVVFFPFTEFRIKGAALNHRTLSPTV